MATSHAHMDVSMVAEGIMEVTVDMTFTRIVVIPEVVVAAAHTEGAGFRNVHQDQFFVNTWSLLLNFQSGFHQNIEKNL
jgi:hypothetical protein